MRNQPDLLLRRARRRAGLSLRALADRAGTSSATLSNYEQGHKVPRLDTLERLVGETGHDLRIDAVPRGRPLTREERRSLHLHRAIADRLRADPAGVLARARVNLATMRRADVDGRARRWLDRWAALLDQPVDAVVGVMEGTGEEARELRQNTPFAGVLGPRDRWAAYREFAECDPPTSTT